MKQTAQKSILQFIFLSCLFHILLFTGISLYESLSTKIRPDVVTLDLIEKPVALNAKKMLPRPDQQVVDQDEKPVNDEVPNDTRFLSRNNQKVVKQTVTKNKGEFQNKSAQSAPPKGSRSATPSLKNFTPTLDPFAIMQKQIAQEKERKGSENSENSKTDQASQSPDYLKDVDQGLETMLSTKEFKYYTYFNRIRRQLSQHWEPKVRERLNKMFRQGRSIASSEDKITRLVIFLNQAGQLVKVQVLSESGVSDLDEAAIDAFRAAAPFPNPPQGIIDSDGTAKIRWDFVLES